MESQIMENDGTISESVEAEDIQNEIAKIKGDAIGNTLYSERWVLRTLIRLSKFPEEESWCDELEQDLCLLWDMTTDVDVVRFILAHDVTVLLTKAISSSISARLTEILIGILGNICCHKCGREDLSKRSTSCAILMTAMDSEDSLTLVQLIRLLNSCLWPLRMDSVQDNTRSSSPVADIDRGDNSHEEPAEDNCWLDLVVTYSVPLVQRLQFFLCSSTNEELLRCSLELVETLLKTPRLQLGADIAESAEFTSGLIEALKQLLVNMKTGDSLNCNKGLWRACSAWRSIISIIATYQQGRENLGKHGNTMLKFLIKLMYVLTSPEALKTQEPRMVMECLYILETLPQVQPHPRTVARLISVVHRVSGVHESNGTNNSSNNSSNSLEMDISESNYDEFDLGELVQRTEHYIRQCLDRSDEPASVLQALDEPHLEYLYGVVGKDDKLSKKLYDAIITLRTSGLVQ